jgi:hypothetical protein
VIQRAGGRPLEIYNRVVQAYEIRSTFIHGAPIPPDKQGMAPRLCEQVLDYARLALIVFLDLRIEQGEKFDKERFLGRLDNSMLDETARRKLTQTLSQLALTQSSLGESIAGSPGDGTSSGVSSSPTDAEAEAD